MGQWQLKIKAQISRIGIPYTEYRITMLYDADQLSTYRDAEPKMYIHNTIPIGYEGSSSQAGGQPVAGAGASLSSFGSTSIISNHSSVKAVTILDQSRTVGISR